MIIAADVVGGEKRAAQLSQMDSMKITADAVGGEKQAAQLSQMDYMIVTADVVGGLMITICIQCR